VNIAAGQISIRHGFRGPNHCVSTACAAGAHAIGDAYNWIRLGYADLMLAGGTESCISPLAIAGFARLKALSSQGNPEVASRPFDRLRDGFVMGEGAAILVLEELATAVKRNAPIICEMVGYGVSGDAHHITSPSPNGDGARRAMLSALRDANLRPRDIHYINAHATSTPLGDDIEVAAIDAAFGSSSDLHQTRAAANPLYVSSTKGATGHMLGAAGAIEAAFTTLSLRDNMIPPTLNLHDPTTPPASFSHVPLVPIPIPPEDYRYAMTNSFGFGGTNASLIFKKFDVNKM